jgi:ubiquinone/menaquinone biosynthesis C-methylase UbiE
MGFQETSYRLHEEQAKNKPTFELENYRNWFDNGTVDVWRHTRMFGLLEPLLSEFPGAEWLAVGDGSYGTASIYLNRAGAKALPVDIETSLLELSVKNGLIEEYRKENAESLSFADDSFDFALCKEAYHHFPRPFIAVYEMLRVSRHAVILIEPADWLPSPVPRRVLQAAKNVVRRVMGKTAPHPDTGNYEPVGNYVYSLSEREVEKLALGLNLPSVAFRRFHDVYIEGVEFERIADNGELYKRTQSALRKNDLLNKLGLITQNHIAAVIFKRKPTPSLVQKLGAMGFRVITLPQNPYV